MKITRLTQSAFIASALFLTACQSPLVKTTPTENQYQEKVQQAESLYKAQQFEQALPIYQELNTVMPENAVLWLRSGNIQARLGNNKQAIENYRQAVTHNPKLTIAWHNMGVLQLREVNKTFKSMQLNTPPNHPLYPRAASLVEATGMILAPKKAVDSK